MRITGVKLSQHFTLEEALRSDTADREGIINAPKSQDLVYMTLTAHTLLEPMRELYGNKPLRVSSFYRNKALNRAIGGASRSSHMDGRAADITAQNGLNVDELFTMLINSDIPFDKAIIERSGRTHWLHAQIARIGERPRGLVLAANFDPDQGKMIYSTV